MKITCQQNQQSAIIAGIEPSPTGQLVVDIDLSTLTPEQRTVLATMTTCPVVRGDQSEVVAEIEKIITYENARSIREVGELDEMEKGIIACERAALGPMSPRTMRGGWSGDKVTGYCLGENTGMKFLNFSGFERKLPSVNSCWGLLPQHADRLDALKSRSAEVTAKNDAEIRAANDAAFATALPAMQADLVAFLADQAVEKEKVDAAARAEKLAKLAKRLETGIVDIPLTRGDRSDWGEPWIAKVSSRNGRKPEYDFSPGSYDASTEILSIPCKPGEVIAHGQKNYRRPKRTIHVIQKMRADGELESA